MIISPFHHVTSVRQLYSSCLHPSFLHHSHSLPRPLYLSVAASPVTTPPKPLCIRPPFPRALAHVVNPIVPHSSSPWQQPSPSSEVPARDRAAKGRTAHTRPITKKKQSTKRATIVLEFRGRFEPHFRAKGNVAEFCMATMLDNDLTNY
jgi:hypothetical protein